LLLLLFRLTSPPNWRLKNAWFKWHQHDMLLEERTHATFPD
jgi:hypothetical protein